MYAGTIPSSLFICCVKIKIAVWASMGANFVLCVIQSTVHFSVSLHFHLTDYTFFAVYAAISSLSLALLATGIDSVFDMGSNIMLFWLHRKAKSLDVDKWPVGGARLETIGNIIYGKSQLLSS